jgi:hypothetical protein
MKKFISFDIHEATKYYNYIQNRYKTWSGEYNDHLRKINKHPGF